MESLLIFVYKLPQNTDFPFSDVSKKRGIFSEYTYNHK